MYYAKWKIHRHFKKVHFIGEYEEKNRPIFVIANHVSWWDGIWIMFLNINFFKRKFHFMMLEEMIEKNRVANLVGGFSIKKGSRSIIESLNYTAELLSDKNNMVLVFPQGEITSLYSPQLEFEKGFRNVLKKVGEEPQIFFIVNLVDYFSDTKPSLYVYFKEYENKNLDSEKMQSDFNQFYSECISENLKRKDDQ